MLKKSLFILVLPLIISAGCTGPIAKKNEPEQDMFIVKSEAASAYEAGDMAESEKLYGLLVKNIPEEAEYWFRLGNIYARTQRPGAAITAYRESLIRKPEFTKAWYNMGITQLKQAAHSFNQMSIYVDAEDPLHLQGRTILDSIIDLINRDNNSDAHTSP